MRLTGAPETGFSTGIHRKADVASGARKRDEGGTVGELFWNARRHAHRAVTGLKIRGVAPPALVSKTSTEDSIPVLVADGVCDDRPVVVEQGETGDSREARLADQGG